jgi:hypothetical protein
MRRCMFFVFLLVAQLSFGQTIEETYKKTLWSANDTFLLKFSNGVTLYPYEISSNKVSPGTDASPGLYATIYHGKDSLRLSYHNQLPYAHIIYVNLESPKGKNTLRLHFNEVFTYFPVDYMDKNEGNVQFDIPESYELANILWTLSPSGQRATDLNKAGEYYKRVAAYFKPYMNHPVLKALDFPDSVYSHRYYDFRENSFAFNFNPANSALSNSKLNYNGPYYHVYGKELADSSLFGKLKPLVEDFAERSGFRKFYESNSVYYANEVRRQKELLPARQMWKWLEDQFPQNKYQSYRIVFSPLIGGSHSTQRFSTYNKTGWFTENVMFICGTDRYDKMPDLSEKHKEGLMSGIVFTEIDHNYVNPATGKYAKLVDSIFSDRAVWSTKRNTSDFYGSPVSVFNEYMTHAVFSLYILDTYDKPTADFIIDYRESLMVNKRNFIKFKEFNRELIKKRQEHKELNTAELYPFMIDWCKKQS